jgi:hypothetical protein
MEKLKIIVFGSDNCPKCMMQKKEFNSLGVPFEFVDALIEENQKLCDHMDVEELPHSICFLEAAMKPVHEYRGFIFAQLFMDQVVRRLSKGKQVKFVSNIHPHRGRAKNEDSGMDFMK